jgi:Protein of unknown function (DUF3298).
MKSGPVTVDKIVVESTMNYMDSPVLHYRIEYPRFHHLIYQDQMDRINQWYRSQAEALQQNYETELYKEAVEQFEYSKTNQFPFNPYDAVSVYDVTYNQNDILSLYFDDYVYSGGAHGNTVRHSDTWNIKSGCRISLFQNVEDPDALRTQIINVIKEQIAEQMKGEANWYFDEYPQFVTEYFNPESFYLMPDGVVFYYQQYEIAPYSSGIPEFKMSLN